MKIVDSKCYSTKPHTSFNSGSSAVSWKIAVMHISSSMAAISKFGVIGLQLPNVQKQFFTDTSSWHW